MNTVVVTVKGGSNAEPRETKENRNPSTGPSAGVGIVTVRQFEAGKGESRRATLVVIKQALETAGVEFTNGDRPGVRLGRSEDMMLVASLI
jgi:hypothetical protein